MSCCLGTSNDNQITVGLEPMKLHSSSGEDMQLSTSLEEFSRFLESNLDWKHNHIDSNGNLIPPVSLRFSEDAGLLQCKKAKGLVESKKFSVLGIHENQSLYYDHSSPEDDDCPQVGTLIQSEKEMAVIVEAYRPNNTKITSTGCICFHPCYDWTRTVKNDPQVEDKPQRLRDNPCHARIKFFDFSELQLARRRRSKVNASNPETGFLMFDSPGSVCHLLRSVLKCGEQGTHSSSYSKYGSHCASPWRDFCVPQNMVVENEQKEDSTSRENECDYIDQVICIIFCNQIDCSNETSQRRGEQPFWDELEERELREFMNFRTSDACPNFYLYSLSNLKPSFCMEDNPKVPNKCSRNGYTLLVYRHLPRRPQFTSTLDSEQKLFRGCLWERVKCSSQENTTTTEDDSFIHRMVGPPYQEVTDIYGDLLKSFTCDENLKTLLAEASTIPQWTAWPEKNHYQSEYDESENIDSVYPASWTVFPLCHTFPAHDVSKRQFIPLTCGFVPETTKLLKSLGPYLRTALFSRLEPRTTLGAHTGWSDLANHVLRVHIPLKIPTGNGKDGLCGTWVDGCVETHCHGRIICFDDSKVHRAFNYSGEDRIVLIIDLARPENDCPLGTATGGHTDELDEFIKQFTN